MAGPKNIAECANVDISSVTLLKNKYLSICKLLNAFLTYAKTDAIDQALINLDFKILDRYLYLTSKYLRLPTDPIENIPPVLIRQRCLKAANQLIQVKLTFSDIIIELDKFVQFREIILVMIEYKEKLDSDIDLLTEKLEICSKIIT